MNYLNLNLKPKKGYGYIYKYTSPSGKSYIGQTIQSITNRAQNGKGYKNCTVFYRAINKYGLENFTIEILEEVPEELLNEKEQYYVKKYNSLIPHGYNSIQCSSKLPNKAHSSKIDVYDLELQYIRTFDSLKEAAKEYAIPYQAISQCINHKIDYYKNYVYVYHGERPKAPHITKTHGRLIASYNDDDELIEIYPSANEAAREIGQNTAAGRNIRSVCEGKRQHAYGFKWRYLD